MLRADDIDKGMYVTVLTGKREVVQSMFGAVYEQEDREGKGAILRVLAVSYPYVAVVSVKSGAVMTIDLREKSLCRVSKEFVRALRPKKKAKKRYGKIIAGATGTITLPEYETFAAKITNAFIDPGKESEPDNNDEDDD